MSRLDTHKTAMTDLGVPWVYLKFSRFEDVEHTINIIGEDMTGETLECKVAYSPGSGALAALPVSFTQSSTTWAGLVSDGVILSSDIPETVAEGDSVDLSVVSIQTDGPNLAALEQNDTAGTPSTYYFETRSTGANGEITFVGSVKISETIS